MIGALRPLAAQADSIKDQKYRPETESCAQTMTKNVASSTVMTIFKDRQRQPTGMIQKTVTAATADAKM
jgi:hypothetical protein